MPPDDAVGHRHHGRSGHSQAFARIRRAEEGPTICDDRAVLKRGRAAIYIHPVRVSRQSAVIAVAPVARNERVANQHRGVLEGQTAPVRILGPAAFLGRAVGKDRHADDRTHTAIPIDAAAITPSIS